MSLAAQLAFWEDLPWPSMQGFLNKNSQSEQQGSRDGVVMTIASTDGTAIRTDSERPLSQTQYHRGRAAF